MNIDKRWILLLAVAAGAAAVASASRGRQRRTAHDLDHKMALKSWENEGGNLAPPAMAPPSP